MALTRGDLNTTDAYDWRPPNSCTCCLPVRVRLLSIPTFGPIPALPLNVDDDNEDIDLEQVWPIELEPSHR